MTAEPARPTHQPTTPCAQRVPAGGVRARDLHALARCRRVRAGRRGSTADQRAAAVRDHPAAAQRHRALHLGHASADVGRGPDDPPRADAGPADALAAGRRPRVDRRPGRARPDHRRGGRERATRWVASATSSACGSSSTRRATSCSSSSAAWAQSVDWSRLRFTMDEVSARAVRVAFKRLYDDGLAYRAEALINWCPGCRTSVSDLEVDRDARDRDALVDALPPVVPRRHARSGRDHHGRDDPPRDDPRRHRRGRPSRRPALRGARRAARALIPFVDRDVPIIADERRRAGLRHGRGQDHARPRPRRLRHGQRHDLPMIDVMTDDGAHQRERRRPTPASSATRRDSAILADLEAARRPGRGARRTRWSSVAASAATTSSSRASRRSGSSGPAHGRSGARRRRGRAARRSCPPGSRRSSNWMKNIRDWNVSRQLWWGHRIPAWYCPDGHVTVSRRPRRPDACEVCGAASPS